MRVYLNDMGIISALGQGKKEVLTGLLNGDTGGIGTHGELPAPYGSLPFGGVTTPLVAIPDDLRTYQCRNVGLALTAIQQFEDKLTLSIEQYGADRIAVVAASTTSGIENGEQALLAHNDAGRFPDGFDYAQQEIGSVGESLARHFGIDGPAMTLSTACSAGAKVFGAARRLIESELADAVLVGGADSFSKMTLYGFRSLSALSSEICLPFSRNRKGTTLGEGAAFFLMTREPIGPCVAGVGESSDAYNVTSPEPSGRGARAAMEGALADAALEPQMIDYVNLHGTATAQNDAAEAIAMSDVFNARVPCSSTKPMTGHALGAAGAIETGLCWLLLSDLNGERKMPPNVWDGAGEDGDFSHWLVSTTDQFSESGPRWCMSNSYAFGGSNASVILGNAVQ